MAFAILCLAWGQMVKNWGQEFDGPLACRFSIKLYGVVPWPNGKSCRFIHLWWCFVLEVSPRSFFFALSGAGDISPMASDFSFPWDHLTPLAKASLSTTEGIVAISTTYTPGFGNGGTWASSWCGATGGFGHWRIVMSSLGGSIACIWGYGKCWGCPYPPQG